MGWGWMGGLGCGLGMSCDHNHCYQTNIPVPDMINVMGKCCIVGEGGGRGFGNAVA